MKILILRFSSIGDIVLTTPVMRCIKKQRPDVEIHYLTKPQFKGVVEHNPYIDHLHLLKENLADTIADLKAEKFDHIIDLHHNLRTLRIKNALGVAAHSFDKLNWKKWLLVHLHINRMPAVHIVDRYMDAASFLQIKDDGAGLDYFIPEKDILHNCGNLSLSEKYIAFVIGATHATKRLPNEKIISICKQLHLPVVLLGGKAEAADGETIARAAGRHVINTCGQFNLNQSASIVQQSAWVITHDTGLMHIAAAFKKPVVSVWGNTVPAFGMYPYYGTMQVDSLVSEVTGLNCRPCTKIGKDKCPKGHFKCMLLQDEAQIVSFKGS